MGEIKAGDSFTNDFNKGESKLIYTGGIIPGKNKRLDKIDYVRYDSPYNTYLYNGLPPGPINSPGIDAIKAAAYPQKTDFMFFVAKGDNRHHFTRTEKEHINAKNKYLKRVW